MRTQQIGLVYALILLKCFADPNGTLSFPLCTHSLSPTDINPETLSPLKISLPDLQHYYATLSIGTPPQELNVSFDTFSQDSWVVTETCVDCNFSRKFNQKESVTYESSTTKTTSYVMSEERDHTRCTTYTGKVMCWA